MVHRFFVFLFILLLPTQLGSFFFFDFSYIAAIRTDYLAPAIYLSDIVGIILIGLYIKPVLQFLSKRVVLMVLALLAFTLLFSTSYQIGLYKLVKIVEWFALFAVFKSVVQDKWGGKYIGLAFGIGAAVELFLSTWQLAAKQTIQGAWYYLGERALSITTPDVAVSHLNGALFLRPYGTFSHPNSMAGFYLLVYFFLLFWQPFKAYPRLRGVSLFICTLLVFISFSKVAIGAFVLLNTLIFLDVIFKNKCRFCGITRFIVLIAVMIVFIIPQGDPYTVDKRVTLVDNAVSIISKRPVAGVGLGNYLYTQAKYPNQYDTYFLQPVHNILLLHLAETGFVVGGIILLLLGKRVVPKLSMQPFLFCFLCVFLTGMLDHYWLTLQQNILISTVVFGLLWKK